MKQISDLRTTTFKLVQQKGLPVIIEQTPFSWEIRHDDYYIHEFISKEKAIQFCRELGFSIKAYIYNKQGN